jgi:hypothetical protein
MTINDDAFLCYEVMHPDPSVRNTITEDKDEQGKEMAYTSINNDRWSELM